jgi:Tetracyclin repressor-like, C-terminal domain
MTRAVALAGPTPLERFRATGIAYVRFAVANPAHFRVMNLPGMSAHIPAAQRVAAEAWRADERARLIEAQRRGELASLDLEDLFLAAFSLVHGLAHAIVEGQEGFKDVDEARAIALATAVTRVLGQGLLPRDPPRKR